MVATLDIRKARDCTGQEIMPTVSFKSGFARYVPPMMHEVDADAIIKPPETVHL